MLHNMSAVTDAGWIALAEALPQLPALESVTMSMSSALHHDRAMGSAFALAFASALPRCALTFREVCINWAHPRLTAAARATVDAAWEGHIFRANTQTANVA
jgi:hypothetical protein